MQLAASPRRQRPKRESMPDAETVMSHPLLLAWLTLAIVFGLLWWRQTATRNATSVDAAWALAIGAGGALAACLGDGAPLQRAIAGGIAVCWGGRLGWHLLRHRVYGHAGEDGRYRAMREHWGPRANANLFWFYQAQAGAAFLFALPFWFVAQHAASTLSALQWTGLALTVLALLGEATADRQLEQHRRDPAQRGRTCRRGLWRYSRHPNYFFEWLAWCGIATFAWPAAAAYALAQPIAMFLLVRFVSGVPFTELQAAKSRGDDYRRYQRETNAFFPWFPRRGADA
jgi:steroid 5-alpha reductase family enzyme